MASRHPESEYKAATDFPALLGTVWKVVLYCYVFTSPLGGVFLSYDAFSKCHPLTNFLFFLGAIGFSVVIQHPAYLTVSCFCAGIYLILLWGRKGRLMVLSMIPVFWLLALINPLFNTLGDTVLFYFFGRPYTWEALCYGMAVSGIFVAMMLWFSCYSLVLTSDKFVCLFGSLIPSLSLLLVMVLRMIPNLLRRGSQIMDVRRSIGKGAEEGSSKKEKVIDGMHILSAMTDWALEGGIVTADSMRSRGYGCARRTSFHTYRIQFQDVVLLISMAVLLSLTVFAGDTAAVYTPEIQISPLSWGVAAYCGYLSIPIILHGKESLQWHISISRI